MTIGKLKLGKPKSRSSVRKRIGKNEEATITEVPIDDATTTQNETVITTADENSTE